MNKTDGIIKIMVTFALGVFTGICLIILKLNVDQKRIENANVLYTIKIENEYINVRKDATTKSEKIDEVLQNEEYQVIETYTENEYYDWYKIKIGTRRTGWVACDKEGTWVTILED